jgi:transcriptional regulator with XRE-family HTH domain
VSGADRDDRTGPDGAVMAGVARTVRALRRSRGLSADQLAARAGVSKGSLVALENAAGNPNLATLVRLADALGVPVTQLIGEPPGPPVRVYDAAQATPLWHGPHGGSARILVTTPTPAPVELWRWDLRPGESYQSHPHPTGLVETATVISGTAVITVDGTDYPLRPGLTAVYGGDAEHSFRGGEPDGGCLLMTVHLPADQAALPGPDQAVLSGPDRAGAAQPGED